ncbi:MAG: hypothetical protein ACLU4U_11960 [[Clostridium] leptum]
MRESKILLEHNYLSRYNLDNDISGKGLTKMDERNMLIASKQQSKQASKQSKQATNKQQASKQTSSKQQQASKQKKQASKH